MRRISGYPLTFEVICDMCMCIWHISGKEVHLGGISSALLISTYCRNEVVESTRGDIVPMSTPGCLVILLVLFDGQNSTFESILLLV